VLRWSAGALAGGLLARATGCATDDEEEAMTATSSGGGPSRRGGRGRLRLDLGTPTGDVVPGTTPLGVTSTRDALLRVPTGAHGSPSPLVLLLHGAGGDAAGGLSLLADLADDAGVVLVAISSRGPTWDVLVDDFGVDVDVAGRAIGAASERVAVDPGRLAIGGFSDGASYALSLGLTNGDAFGHVLALSPGFAAPADEIGRPRCYVSHGTEDGVLPIDRCSRRIVPSLRARGYDVSYTEFDGGHEVPPTIAREALATLIVR
jgi:predicted esterase